MSCAITRIWERPSCPRNGFLIDLKYRVSPVASSVDSSNTISVTPRPMIPSTFCRKNSACSGVALKSPSCLPTIASGVVP